MEGLIFSLISKTWSQASMGTVAVASPPSFLSLSQESSAQVLGRERPFLSII